MQIPGQAVTGQATSRAGPNHRHTSVICRPQRCARGPAAAPDTHTSAAEDSGFENTAFMARLRAGDHTAYRDLVLQHHATLVALADRLSRNRAAAEDVVQDVWLIVLSNPHLLDQHPALGVSIAALVTNVAQASARHHRRRHGFAEAGRIDGNGEALAVPHKPARPAGRPSLGPGPWDRITPETEYGDRQLLHHLDHAIATLPAVQRAAIRLRDVQGHGSAETCRLLGLSSVNLRVLLHRARIRLRASIDRITRPLPNQPVDPPAAPPAPSGSSR